MINEKGYYRPTYDEILNTSILRTKELLGNNVDTSDRSVLGKLLRIDANEVFKLYEEQEKTYLSSYPNTAEGVSLDRLCTFAGVFRNPATYAVHIVEFTGDPGFTVDVGTLVGTDNQVYFYVAKKLVLDATGIGTTEVQAVKPGITGNAFIGEIKSLINPVVGLTGIKHISKKTGSLDAETDYELRTRFKDAISGSGAGNTDSIRSAVLRCSGVSSVTVVENAENVPDSGGRPPHSFEVYVNGGQSLDIATAIFTKKPVGISSVGAELQEIADLGGFLHNIRFTRVRVSNIFVEISVRVNKLFGVDGVDSIKKEVENYVDNLGNGGTLYYNSIFGHIYKNPGVTEVVTLRIGTTLGNLGTSNIPLSFEEIAQIASITVNVL